MMHVRYKLREPKQLITPKGPSFSSARSTSCDIDGTVITFKAPKHRPQHANRQQLLPKRTYKMEEMIFRSSFQEGFNVRDDWKDFKLFSNAWAFYGSWFTGTLAELEMYISLIKPVNNKNTDFSLFHPRAFEKVIGDYLTNEFSGYTSELQGGKHHYIAPVNWQPLESLPVVSARLEVAPDENVISRTTRYLMFFPISNKVMACIQFIPSQLRAATQEDLDKRVSRSTMLELMNNIINSFQLTLSPQAIEQQKKALEGLEDVSLIKDYPPLKWSKANKIKSLS